MIRDLTPTSTKARDYYRTQAEVCRKAGDTDTAQEWDALADGLDTFTDEGTTIQDEELF